MKRIAPLLLAGLVSLPGLAGDKEVSLFYSSASGRSGSINQAGSPATTLESDKFTGLGLRFGTTLAKLGPADLSMDASWRMSSKSDLKLNGTKIGQYEWSYLAVGAMATWHVPLDLGVGLDLRSVQAELIQQAPGSEQHLGVNHFSPWLRAQVGYTFPAPAVKPFVRLEFAMDLASQGDYTASSSNLDFNKAYGVALPKSELSLQAGFRF